MFPQAVLKISDRVCRVGAALLGGVVLSLAGELAFGNSYVPAALIPIGAIGVLWRIHYVFHNM